MSHGPKGIHIQLEVGPFLQYPPRSRVVYGLQVQFHQGVKLNECGEPWHIQDVQAVQILFPEIKDRTSPM